MELPQRLKHFFQVQFSEVDIKIYMNKHFQQKRNNNGQAVIIAIILFSFGSFIFIGGVMSTILSDIKEVNNLMKSKKSFYLSESSLEDVIYRIKNAVNYSTTETLIIDGNIATTTVLDIQDGKSIVSTGNVLDLIRISRVDVIEGIGASFFYGMQTGVGGIIMENNSTVQGNVYSNGNVIGLQSNIVKGDVVSAGVAGFVDGLHATGSVYSNVIQNSIIEKDAHYTAITNSTVFGIEYPGSADQEIAPLAISDELIDELKTQAEAGGIISSPCPYIINEDTTLGPVKITCDLTIDKQSTTVTLGGPVWVEGDIRTKSGPTILIPASFGRESIAIIADNPNDRLTSSKIILQNNAIFQGSGTTGSYVLLISQNESAESNGSEKAILAQNSASGDLLVYAAHGEIEIQNNTSLKEVSAYRIRTKNSAEIIYETGLSSLLFDSGPGGGFEIDSWGEIE